VHACHNEDRISNLTQRAVKDRLRDDERADGEERKKPPGRQKTGHEPALRAGAYDLRGQCPADLSAVRFHKLSSEEALGAGERTWNRSAPGSRGLRQRKRRRRVGLMSKIDDRGDLPTGGCPYRD